ncbi:hypothetical protein [Lentilactobacillus sunkii]|uniref:hypothetical protein n=1 Tax=Lentilactobacillus sunkii TaxID=481719 RepID=UPI00070E2AF8|nr:hypothetical protein [Lentilactobacillus sunkii]
MKRKDKVITIKFNGTLNVAGLDNNFSIVNQDGVNEIFREIIQNIVRFNTNVSADPSLTNGSPTISTPTFSSSSSTSSLFEIIKSPTKLKTGFYTQKRGYAPNSRDIQMREVCRSIMRSLVTSPPTPVKKIVNDMGISNTTVYRIKNNM